MGCDIHVFVERQLKDWYWYYLPCTSTEVDYRYPTEGLANGYYAGEESSMCSWFQDRN